MSYQATAIAGPIEHIITNRELTNSRPETDAMLLGQRLNHAISLRGKSVVQFADEIGQSHQQVVRRIGGSPALTADEIVNYSKHLDIDPDLLTDPNYTPKQNDLGNGVAAKGGISMQVQASPENGVYEIVPQGRIEIRTQAAERS